MEKYHVVIEGVAPLLQNKMDFMEDSDEKINQKKDTPEICEKKLYTLDEKVCQPGIMIERAMIKAATGIKQKGAGKKTYKDLFVGSVFVRPDYIVHKKQDWEVHQTTVVIKATRGRINRYRPMLKEWELEFDIEVLDNRISKSIVKLALDEAGRTIGIGDWRPRYGRFIVKHFE